jgi:RHS repeat-associated protein
VIKANIAILPTPSDVQTGAYKSTAQSLATSFYDNDANPFTETIFEASPANRPLKGFGAGQNWRTANKFVATDYSIADAGDVPLWNVSSTGATKVSGGYGAGQLLKTTTTSEQGNKVVQYKDKDGNIIRKDVEYQSGLYMRTLYIYDDFLRLRFVVQPNAYETLLTQSSFTQSSTVYLEGIFSYKYDNLGRVTESHIAGAGTKRFVYDKNDRVVLENDDRDANIPLPDRNYYKFTKYDIFGRVVQTGLIFGIGGFDRSQLQKDFDDFANISTNLTYEERGTDLMGYTNRSFPSSYTPIESSLRTVTYYDDYDNWQTDVNYNFKSAQAFHIQASAKGMVTGTLVRNLETNVWYKFVNFYDYFGRIIQQYAQNNVGGVDRTDYQYRFNGEVLKMRMTHQKTGVADLIEQYEYQTDHAGRKLSFVHNGNVVAKYEYDAIGRLQKKKLSPAGNALASSQTGNWHNANTWQSGTLPLSNDNVTINAGNTVTISSGQTASAGTLNDNGTLLNFGTLNMGKSSTTDLYVQTMKYHIRGGLKSINTDASGNLTNSLFSFKLRYEEDGNLYDGNIRSQEWQSSIDNIGRAYYYEYDAASRIKKGTYAGGQQGEKFSLNNVDYDKNGNITNLSRNGWRSDNTFGLVDDLNYTYNPNSNKILKVDDTSNNTASFADVAGNDYTYGLDGSLLSDANKGITIEYNYLKKPKKITFANTQTIEYEYDASGRKIREKDRSGIWMDYVGNKIYKNSVLYQIGMDEGRINAQGEYEYGIQDHLGNVRVMFKDSLGVPKITQTENFGVWGESLSKINYYRTANNKQQFVYTGHERNEELGVYDAKARVYDPIVPHFWQIDPKSELSRRWSPFSYTFDNPLKYTDPDGLNPYLIYNNKTKTLKIYDDNGTKSNYKDDKLLGTFKAHNNVASSSKGKWEDGTYSMVDKNGRFTHPGKTEKDGVTPQDSKNGRYGEGGIYRAQNFNETTGDKIERGGMAVHAGRENKEFEKRCTMGCIRTTLRHLAVLIKQ